ncbi:L,D-transpeptidase family protein [Terrihabitans sp. B22-R8]|uniref:L,D-transpeptidase family protein n=1 Tax=Terrihabitans sp. B22-R8 TaxID=3425128 RepID=UPI00403D2788
MRRNRDVACLIAAVLATTPPLTAWAQDAAPAIAAEAPAETQAVAPQAAEPVSETAPAAQAGAEQRAPSSDAAPAAGEQAENVVEDAPPPADLPLVPQTVEPAEPATPHFDAAPPAQIAEQAPAQTIESLIATRLGEDKRDAEIAAFYAARNNAPIWVEGTRLGDKARAVAARIGRADEDGLDRADFVLPETASEDGSPEALAAAEIALSRAAVSYARQAQGGRTVPNSISAYITAKPTRPAPADVLSTLSSNEDGAAWIESYNPPHAQFVALKGKLAELRKAAAEAEEGPALIPPGPVLKPGMQDARVPLLRTRLGVPDAGTDIYDEALVEAVRAFQKKSGALADGLLGPRSLAALNNRSTPQSQIELVLVNMERWRWLPRDLGQTHIMVNIPEYHARIVRNGALVHDTRVIVGKTTNQTPIFSDEMQFIVVNPAWNIPASIAKKEMLPNLMRDPYYLARQGMEAIYTGGGRPQVIDSTNVDWSRVDMRKIRFRQPPGERNALGNIKFMFPNEHAVYLHDTPNRGLFANAQRAYSHGCVRVQDPFALADVLLEDSDWNSARMKKLIGASGERRINLAHRVPIHLVYFTAEAGPDGNLVTRPDIYGHDRRMKSAMALHGREQAAIRPRS